MFPTSHADILVCLFLTNLVSFFSCTSAVISPLLLVELLQMVAFMLLYFMLRTSYYASYWINGYGYDIKCESFSKLDISWISKQLMLDKNLDQFLMSCHIIISTTKILNMPTCDQKCYCGFMDNTQHEE